MGGRCVVELWLCGSLNQDIVLGDPQKITVMGHSAGGHLVSLLALDNKYIKKTGLTDDQFHIIAVVYDWTVC